MVKFYMLTQIKNERDIAILEGDTENSKKGVQSFGHIFRHCEIIFFIRTGKIMNKLFFLELTERVENFIYVNANVKIK